MIMDVPLSPCGHRNPPSAHFCDLCGTRLPMQCPRCHTINRSEANFCRNCGIDVREGRHTQAVSSPTEPGSVQPTAETIVSPEHAGGERVNATDALDPRLRKAGGEPPLTDEAEDAARLEHL